MKSILRELAVVSAGGMGGAVVRYSVGWAFTAGHHPLPDGWNWSTLAVNVSGCLLIGVLTAVTERQPARHWVRLFLGTGFLGGYTTFSATYLDAAHLTGTWSRTGYLGGMLGAALLAVWLGRWTVQALRGFSREAS